MAEKGKVIALDQNWHKQLSTRRMGKPSSGAAIRAAQIRHDQAALESRPGRSARVARPAPATEQLYTVPEVAALLKFDESTIYEWCRTGIIRAEHHGKNGRNVRISAAALEDYKRRPLIKHG